MDYIYIASIYKYILEGAWFTFKFWLLVFAGSTILSLILSIIYSMNNSKTWKRIIDTYIKIIRGTPLLFQLYFVYFGLPILFDLNLTPLVAGLAAFILSWTAYMTEIIRGGILSVDKGQYEAAQVLGFNKFQAMTKIIFPQAIISVIPSIGNQAVSLMYGTALLSTIGLNDLLKNARSSVVRDLRLEGFMIAALIYLVLNTNIQGLFKLAEKHLNYNKIKE